jgi:3',5'-cyclic AMP phosphodiesterase CpdA
LLVVISMVCSFIVMLRPAQSRQQPTPTAVPSIPTWTPTPRSTATPQHVPKTSSPPTRQVQELPTRSSINEGQDFVFAVCGDNRGGDEVFRKILDSVETDSSSFLIHTGDFVYHGTEGEFKKVGEMMSGFSLPFYPVPGNHDNFYGELKGYLKYSGAPALHYSFDYGHAHFSFIDTSKGYMPSDELEWLANDLDATSQPLKIVTLHYPPFDPTGTDHIMGGGNEAFMALMVKKGVKLVLTGHIHSYDDAVRDGVRYIITGGAGAPLYPEPNRPAFHHYIRVTVKGEEISTEVVRIADD